MTIGTGSLRRVLVQLVPVALGVCLGAAVLVPVAGASIMSTEAKSCGAQSNTEQAEFSLAHGSDIWQSFPALGITPELENDSNAIHVVVFKGAFNDSTLVIGNGSAQPLLSEVICVVQADGTVNVFSDVSRQGSPYAP